MVSHLVVHLYMYPRSLETVRREGRPQVIDRRPCARMTSICPRCHPAEVRLVDVNGFDDGKLYNDHLTICGDACARCVDLIRTVRTEQRRRACLEPAAVRDCDREQTPYPGGAQLATWQPVFALSDDDPVSCLVLIFRIACIRGR